MRCSIDDFMHYGSRLLLGGFLFLLLGAGTVNAEPTAVAVHVRADDSKFIGSGVGGLNVIIEDAVTGELLDSGRITGETGDTAALMTEGQTRGRSPAAGAADYQASLNIDVPTRIRIRVTGPLAVQDSVQTLTATSWVIPGRDMTEPGIILRMPGLIVALADVSHSDTEVSVEADVTMMCGCPITRSGLWEAADYEVVGVLYRDGEPIARSPLAFAGKANRFRGTLEAPGPGKYQLLVYAFQDQRDNAGVARQTVVVQ